MSSDDASASLRPSSSAYPTPIHTALKCTIPKTFEKLGFVSPSFLTGAGRHSAYHGIVGSYGYLSGQYKELLPTAPNKVWRSNTPQTAAGTSRRHAHAPPPESSERPRGGTAPASSGRRSLNSQLSEQDMRRMIDVNERAQAAWEDWREAKDAELARKRTTTQRLVLHRPRSQESVDTSLRASLS